MTAEIRSMAPDRPTESVEMFVSLLLARVRQEGDVAAIVYAVIDNDGAVDIGSSGVEIRDLAYMVQALQLYTDDHIRRNANLDDGS